MPEPGDNAELEIPVWDGNRFLLPGSRRPVLRTMTPRLNDRENGRLMLDVVVHGDGAAARWASEASEGSPVAVSGPARGYSIDPQARSLILAGDETAIAAISQILEALAQEVDASVYLETPRSARPALPDRPRCEVHWIDQEGDVPGGPLADEVGEVQIPESGRLWAAGEAAAMQRLRRRLFDDRGIARAQATIRGYWKHGRGGDDQGNDQGSDQGNYQGSDQAEGS
jgi:NADPH-dependent ferric siderophore reductase